MNHVTRILSIVTLVLGLILAIGVEFLFHACGAKDDGSWMACHWAQQTVFGLGLVLAAQGAIAAVSKTGRARAAVSAAMIPTAVLAVSIPGAVIHLCMMADMQCQAVMKPGVRLVAALIVIVSIVNTILSAIQNK